VTNLHSTGLRLPLLRALPGLSRLLGRAPSSPTTADALDRAGSVERQEHGYAVLVEFAAGDHEYWDWRPRERTAQRLCRRDRAYFAGCGIVRMTVVPMTHAQARQHAEFSRCRAGNCLGLTSRAP
jgi:hypothetical protein